MSDNMPVSMQFDDAEQEHEAATLGMWSFLATEVLFFGAVLVAFNIYRMQYPEAFYDGGHELYPWVGTFNTCVLLFSSFTMACAVHEVESQCRRGKLVLYLVLTCILGSAFIGVKACEYTIDWHEGLIPMFNWHPKEMAHPQMQMFFLFYFTLTMIHALHMTIGIIIMLFYIARVRRPDYASDLRYKIEMFGLYWHFVDIVWIFLFPILYLIA